MFEVVAGSVLSRPSADGRVRAPGVERVLDLGEPVHGAEVGGLCGHPLLRAHRGDDGQFVLHGVENHHHAGAHEKGVGRAHRIGLVAGKLLDEPHRVVAQIAEHARRHGRQMLGDVELGGVEQLAQRLERAGLAGLECVRVLERALVDLGHVAVRAPEHVGIEADDRIAAAHGAAFDGFEKEGVGPVGGELQHGRDGRFKIGDQLGGDKLGHSSSVVLGEFGKRRFDLHWRGNPLSVEYRGSNGIRPVVRSPASSGNANGIIRDRYKCRRLPAFPVSALRTFPG